MNILTSSYALDLSGVPTFTHTMYRELIRQGHIVIVYSPLGGPLERDMATVRSLDTVPTPDIVLAQSNVLADQMHARYPDTPIVFYAHGVLPAMEQPPKSQMDHYLVINEITRDNYLAHGIPDSKITIIRDFVDIDRFSPRYPIKTEPKKVLFVSNYKKWKNYKVVSGACERLGLDLKCHGSPYGRCANLEVPMNEADIVISWGRGIIEAMACGRAAIAFDKGEGDGYIDEYSYWWSRENNFSCGDFKRTMGVNELVSEIQMYHPDVGRTNRNLAEQFHGAEMGVGEIVSVLRKVVHEYH